MLAFAGFASLALYLRQRDERLSLRTCLVSTSFASMAVWSDFSAAPSILVLPFWVLATRGFRESLRYSSCLAASLSLSTLLFFKLFGVESLRFNVVELPSKHPWIFQGSQRVDGLILFSTEFFCSVVALVATLALTVIVRWIFTPDGSTEPEAQDSGIRRRLVENPWLQFVLMAIASAPTSFLNRIEVGGYLNNYAPTLYFLAMGMISLLLEWHGANRRLGLETLNALLTSSMLLLVLSPMTVCEDYFQVFGVVHRPSKNPHEVASRYSRRHPGTAYFPWNTLSTLLGERKSYHFEYGLVDRELTGYPVTEPHFRQHLPDQLRYVCVPPHYKGLGEQFEKTMKYLPEFARRVEIEERPGWTCYERARVSGGVK